MTSRDKLKKLSREMAIELPELNKARVKLICLAVISMCAFRTVNMAKLLVV